VEGQILARSWIKDMTFAKRVQEFAAGVETPHITPTLQLFNPLFFQPANKPQ
jgi:hypothetical protein